MSEAESGPGGGGQRMIFPQGKKRILVDLSQIVRLEAHSNYTKVYFTEHPPVLMAKVLRAYDALLSPCGFIRPHRSHLVNPIFVSEVDAQGKIQMSDDTLVDVSRRKKQLITRIFSNHPYESSKA